LDSNVWTGHAGASNLASAVAAVETATGTAGTKIWSTGNITSIPNVDANSRWRSDARAPRQTYGKQHDDNGNRRFRENRDFN
jgi:hypothetical protein